MSARAELMLTAALKKSYDFSFISPHKQRIIVSKQLYQYLTKGLNWLADWSAKKIK